MWFLDSKSSLRFDSNLNFESKIHVLSRLVQYVLLLTEVIIAPGFIKKLNIKHYPVIVCLWLTTTQGKINFSWFRQDLWFFHGIHTLFHHKFFWWRSSQLDPGQLTVADDPHIISADNFEVKASSENNTCEEAIKESISDCQIIWIMPYFMTLLTKKKLFYSFWISHSM